MRVLYAPNSTFLYLLYRAVGENALLLTIRIQAFHSAVREADFFRSIWVVLLDLFVLEFEDLHTVGESGLGSFGLREEVASLAFFETLLDIAVLEENYLVAVWPDLPLHTIWKNDFFLTVIIDSLDFTLLANILFDQFLSFLGFIWMVMFWKHEFVFLRGLRYWVFFIKVELTRILLIIFI